MQLCTYILLLDDEMRLCGHLTNRNMWVKTKSKNRNNILLPIDLLNSHSMSDAYEP